MSAMAHRCALKVITRRLGVRSLAVSPPNRLSKEQKLQILASHVSGGNVDLEINNEQGIAVITVNYPEKKNAMTGKMMVDLDKRISELEKWRDGWGLVLKGEGGAFCSGGNLQLMKSVVENKAEGHPAIMCEHMQLTLSRLRNLPLISAAVLEGPTLGGGAEMAIYCDFRIMSDSASLGFLEGRVGLCPGWGGSARLVELVGYKTALRLIASGDILKKDEAMTLGLVDNIFSSEKNSLEEAFAFLRSFVKISPEVVRANKKVLLSASKMKSDAEIFEVEKDTFQSLCGGPANLKFLMK